MLLETLVRQAAIDRKGRRAGASDRAGSVRANLTDQALPTQEV